MANEKPHATETATTLPAGDVETQGFDASATKKLLRKLDWHIIPFMSLIYLYVSNLSDTPHSNKYILTNTAIIVYVSSTAPTSATRASTTSNPTCICPASNTTTASPSSSPSTLPPRSPPT
jgi:hypothetical protein